MFLNFFFIDNNTLLGLNSIINTFQSRSYEKKINRICKYEKQGSI